MSRFIAVDRETAYLLPPSVDAWLPQDHLARFVVEVIEQLDLSELVRQYTGRGSAAYHPAMLLGLLVYGYASGVHSSRKIERACHDSVAFRFIAANTYPDHDSIATFRRRFMAQIEALFVQVPEVLGQAQVLIADTGYFSAANVNACEAKGIEPMLSMKRPSHHMPVLERFAADAPASETDDPVLRMSHKLATKAGRALYGLRKQTVEPVFGIIKRVMEWRQMSMRGLDKARGEWSLVTMAWNIKRLHVLRAA